MRCPILNRPLEIEGACQISEAPICSGGSTCRGPRPTSSDLVECTHCLTADPVLAHHIAEFDGQFVLLRIRGIEASDDDPPARPHYPARDGRMARPPIDPTVRNWLSGYEQLTTAVPPKIVTLCTAMHGWVGYLDEMVIDYLWLRSLPAGSWTACASGRCARVEWLNGVCKAESWCAPRFPSRNRSGETTFVPAISKTPEPRRLPCVASLRPPTHRRGTSLMYPRNSPAHPATYPQSGFHPQAATLPKV